MNEQNNHHMVIYHGPLNLAARLKRRSYGIINYNDPPEVGAMNAHLPAAGYRARGKDTGKTAHAKSPLLSAQRARALVDLGREYDAQARKNFVTEALLFAIIVVAGVAWPAVHSVLALAL